MWEFGATFYSFAYNCKVYCILRHDAV